MINTYLMHALSQIRVCTLMASIHA